MTTKMMKTTRERDELFLQWVESWSMTSSRRPITSVLYCTWAFASSAVIKFAMLEVTCGNAALSHSKWSCLCYSFSLWFEGNPSEWHRAQNECRKTGISHDLPKTGEGRSDQGELKVHRRRTLLIPKLGNCTIVSGFLATRTSSSAGQSPSLSSRLIRFTKHQIVFGKMLVLLS